MKELEENERVVVTDDSFQNISKVESDNADKIESDGLATIPNDHLVSVLDYAKDYTRRGWKTVPAPYGLKHPITKGYPNLIITEEDLPAYYGMEPQNISVLTGEKSSGLTDIDLDSGTAIKIAHLFLPETIKFGREGKRRSHYIYECDEPRFKKFNDPFIQESNRGKEAIEKSQACILEFRGKSGQTIFPPSTHSKSGETIKWENYGKATKIDTKTLYRQAALLAAACLLSKFWTQDFRNELTLCIGGALLRNGFSEAETRNFIRAVCIASNDEEAEQRQRTFDATVKQLSNDKNAYGFPKLAELTDEKLVRTICEWLEIDLSTKEFISPKDLRKAAQKSSGLLTVELFEGKLILEVSLEGKKHKVSAKDEKGVLETDVFNLSESAKRAKFVSSFKDNFNEDEQKEINRALLNLSAQADDLSNNSEQAENEFVQTSFQVLKDGRIIEQIRSGFAVYDPANDSFTIAETVEDSDGTVYLPINDEITQKDGGLYLATDLEEYGSDEELDAEIESYVSRYIDLQPLQLKLTAKYIRFTYLFDKTFELPYLNPTGDAGSGKSRFGITVALASRRGLPTTSISAATLYRVMDKYKPTLFIDEANFDVSSEDTAAIIQVLNAGFQRVTNVMRQKSSQKGDFQTISFDPFGPKIIGALKKSRSIALNSRCIEIQMERTSRNDISLRLSKKLFKDSEGIRNKLTLWRLRNFSNDFEKQLNQAETELKEANLIPRSIQISIPLYALIKDEKTKKDFINLLQRRDFVSAEEKLGSIDGELIQAIHSLLFTIDEQGKISWSEKIEETLPNENEVCEALNVPDITEIFNSSRSDRAKLDRRSIGKQIRSLGLRTEQIKSRKSKQFDKTAVKFDSHRIRILFQNYSLPFPAEWSIEHLEQADKDNLVNNLDCSNDKQEYDFENSSLEQFNSFGFNENEDCSNDSKDELENEGYIF